MSQFQNVPFCPISASGSNFNPRNTTCIVTGAAGFIGFHLAQRLLKDGCHVTGIDNLNNYYDVRLKEARLEILKGQENFTFFKMDLCDRKCCCEPGRTGRCQVFSGKSPCIR